MANTTFEEIYRLFLNQIQDYRIKKLFVEDINSAEDMLETYLIKSIPDFTNCVKSITDANTTDKTFNVELDIEEKGILSDLMVIAWMNWSINNITQMELTLDDTDFKHYSEERNLSGKLNHRNMLREIADQKMINYGFKHTPFKEWAAGNYGL